MSFFDSNFWRSIQRVKMKNRHTWAINHVLWCDTPLHPPSPECRFFLATFSVRNRLRRILWRINTLAWTPYAIDTNNIHWWFVLSTQTHMLCHSCNTFFLFIVNPIFSFMVAFTRYVYNTWLEKKKRNISYVIPIPYAIRLEWNAWYLLEFVPKRKKKEQK